MRQGRWARAVLLEGRRDPEDLQDQVAPAWALVEAPAASAQAAEEVAGAAPAREAAVQA